MDPFSHPHRTVILTSMLRGQGEELTLFVQRLEKLPGRRGRGKGDVWTEGSLLPHLLVLTYEAGSHKECTERLPAPCCFWDAKAETVSEALADRPPLFHIFEVTHPPPPPVLFCQLSSTATCYLLPSVTPCELSPAATCHLLPPGE